MARRYKYTAKRRAALRRAQLISARKRRKRRAKNIARASVGIGALVSTGIVVGHLRGRKVTNKTKTNVVTQAPAQVAATVGTPVVPGPPSNVRRVVPPQANPANINLHHFARANVAHTTEARRAIKRNRWASIANTQGTPISELEAQRRTRTYLIRLEKEQVFPNQEHIRQVREAYRRQTY